MSALQTLINSTFPNIAALDSVDTVIHDLEETAHSTTTPSTTARAEEFLATLKQLSNDPSTDSLDVVDELIAKYGPIPIITYTREIIVQKLDLILERKLHTAFTEVLDKINDFEVFQLTTLPTALTYEIKVELLETVATLRTAINNFQSHFNNENLTNKLIQTLHDLVNTHLHPLITASLTSQLRHWESKPIQPSVHTEFKLLLDLQLLTTHDTNPTTIWAIDCLLNNFKTKFVYHFQGQNETNRIDKPEFALSYALGYLQESLNKAKLTFSAVFANAIQNTPIIQASFSTWFITSLLVIVRTKLAREITHLVESNNLDLLSHYIEEIKKFDESIKFDYAYVPAKGAEWDGLTKDLILDNESVWNNWLSNEKKFVNLRFEEITNMENAFAIDYEIVAAGHTKPTKSAVNLQNLIENITNNYKSLPLKFQLKFLSEVQLKLLNFYFDTLKSGFYALKNIKSVETDGVSTLERICRIWCSAKYMVEMMQKWSNETIFIELWASLTTRDNTDSTFFESVIAGYERDILGKIPNLLKTYIERQLNKNMKEYFQENPSWTFEEPLPSTSTSNSLSYVVHALSQDFNYLQKTVSHTTYNAWKLHISNTVANYFEKNVALSNNFTVHGVDKLHQDIEYVFSTLQLVRSHAQFQKLLAILQVLKTGSNETPHEEVDSAMVAMLLLRRR